jgi:hypothetical protein
MCLDLSAPGVRDQHLRSSDLQSKEWRSACSLPKIAFEINCMRQPARTKSNRIGANLLKRMSAGQEIDRGGALTSRKSMNSKTSSTMNCRL